MLVVVVVMLAAGAAAPAASEPTKDGGASAARLAVDADSVTVITASISPRLEELRGLRFLQPVPVRVESDSVARLHFAARAERDTPPESLRAQARAAALLGLLPPDFDLEKQLLDLIGEQAGGYYDTERKIFVVLGDMPRGAVRTIAAHELTHALDDQHFNLDSLLTVRNDDDHVLALACVVEGSATVVMARFVAEQLAADRMSLQDVAAMAESDAGRAEQLQAAPPMIQRGLVGPYVLGMNFLLRGNPMAQMAVNSDDLNHAFQQPPRSTEQILHPEKYWDAPHADEPRPIPALDAAKLLGSTWRLAGTGVLGELLMAPLVEPDPLPILDLAARGARDWSNAAVTGWGGDRWWLLQDGGHDAVLLATTWDTERDAKEFAAAAGKSGFHLQRSGSWVVLVAGVDEAPAAAAANAALKMLRAGSPRRP